MSSPIAKLRVAAISMTTTADKDRNVETAFGRVREAAAEGADWVQLPEMFHYMGPYEHIWAMAEEAGGPLVRELASLAKSLGIVLVAGSIGERPAAGETTREPLLSRVGHRRVFNTSFVFGRDGALLAKYRKVHPFNLRDASGNPLYCESDGYLSGDEPVTLTVDGWRVALTICYDLRFPEYYARLAQSGAADVILVPSAFTKATGQAHWTLLNRARAVEWQAYVIAANQVGTHGPNKESYGHSVVIDPWGEVLSDSGDSVGTAIAEISQARLAEVRGRLPALANRRPEIYRS